MILKDEQLKDMIRLGEQHLAPGQFDFAGDEVAAMAKELLALRSAVVRAVDKLELFEQDLRDTLLAEYK